MAVQPETLDFYDDRQLVAAFKAGEEDAFARIVGAHYASLLAEARRKVNPTGDAEDAVQETLLRAYLALDRFGGEYRLRAWLSRILANTCADARARRSGELRLFDRLAHRRDEVPAADEGIGDSELRQKVKDAIASLPENYRTAFVLREVEERPYAEVAEEMSVSESNARARVHRARNSLTRALRNTGSALGGFAIPIRLLGWRLFRTRADHGHEANLAAHPEAVGSSVSGMSSTAIHSAALPSSSQAPLSALSQVSQVVTQTVSSPLSQTILAVAPDAGRASLPVAGMLATMAAAGAAMMATGASVLSPVSQAAATTAGSAGSPAAMATYGTASVPAASGESQASVPATTATTGVNPAPSVTSSTTSASDPSQSANLSSDAWDWVTAAATSPGGAVPQSGNSSASTSSASQGSPQAVGSPTSTTSTTTANPVPCPWPGSFSSTSGGAIALPAPQPAGTTPSAYFASDTLQADNSGPAFEVAGQGNYEEPSGSLNIHVLYGACLPGTTDPVLLADLSNQGDPALGELQLAGALVSASSAQGETVALYRGTATWLDGPEVASPPSAFAAEIVFDVPSDISMLRVAFFGTAPDLSGASATCQGQGTGGVSTGATSVPTTSTGTTSACDTSGAGGSGSSSPAAGSTSGSSSASTASTGSGASGSSGGTQGAPQGNGTPAGTPSGSSDGAQSGTTDSSGSPTAAQNAQPTAVAGTTTDPGS